MIVRAWIAASLSAFFLIGSTWAQEAPPNPQAPHGLGHGRPPQNESAPDPTLPEGQLLVEVVDENGRPVPAATVKLLTSFQSIAEGNDDNVIEKKSDPSGRVVFDGLKTAIRYSYAVSVSHQGASYDAPGFRMGKTGHRALIHTFPVSRDPREAFVGIQGYVTVQVNDDLLRVDGAYRVINMGRMTWVPEPIHLRLPADAQGVEAKLTAGDAGFREVPQGMALVGSFPPGQKDLTFAFHVPNRNERFRSIAMSVPPHVVDMNVLIEQAPGLELSVSPGFEPAESRVGRNNKKVLVTRRLMRPGEGTLSEVQIELSGLPVIGPGRWIAVLLALCMALSGFAAAWLRGKKSHQELDAQKDKAREALLSEMLLLEQAHQSGDLGPRTYEQTKQVIIAALARLEPEAGPTVAPPG
jgi:hypothetical protein